MEKILTWVLDNLGGLIGLVVIGGALTLYFLFNPERITERCRRKHKTLIFVIIGISLAIFGLFSFYISHLSNGTYSSWFGWIGIVLGLVIIINAVPLAKKSILLSDGFAVFIQQHQGILRYIIPVYDEVTLFAMSLTCILVLIVGLFSINKVQIDFSTVNPLKLFMGIFGVMVFLAGIGFSIYHALVNEPKSLFEKYFMLFFAAIVSIFSGLAAGAYALKNATGWLVVFPILNIVNSLILYFLFRFHALNESNISDENASPIQIAVTAAIVIILFVICHFISKLVWIQTFSICVAYATNIGRRIQVPLCWCFPSMKETT
jgi:MFS family permease